MTTPYVLPLDDPNAMLETVGGKGLSLAKMRSAGLPVPGGFHVTTAAYRRFVTENELQPQILAALQGMDANDPAALEAAARQIGELFSQGQIPAEIAAAVSTAYAAMQDIPVAVRSSATAEDLPGASFAGQQETYLNIRGEQAVLEAVKKCWASLWTARAIAYRLKQQVDQEAVALAVVVQELIFADAAGILFTANPITGKRDEVVINAAWGLGEAIVSGAVTPDTLTVQKGTGRILHRETAEKMVMTMQSEHGVHQAPVPEPQTKQAVLTRARAAELARLGEKIEAFYGMPMDIEWTLRRDVFAIVQARPITALPPEWKRPVPKAMYTRASLAEQIPNPVTPLFATLGLRAVNQATVEFGQSMSLDALDIEYQYRPINGYVFMGFLMKGKALWGITTLGLKSFTYLLAQSIPRWQASRQALGELLDRWEQRDLATSTPSELLAGVYELFTQVGRLYTVLQSGPVPTSTLSEALFTGVYRLAKRKGDPEATAFLFGFDTVPILTEKSLFDLAMKAKSQPALAEALRRLPAAELAAALETGVPPEGIPAAAWVEWQGQFQAHLRTYGRAVYDLDFANPTPAETPALLLETIKMYLAGQGNDPYERQRLAMERREQVTQQLLARLRWPLKGWLQKSLHWALETGPAREDSLADLGMANPQIRRMLGELGRRFVAGGALDAPEEIYWLEESEAVELAALLEKGQSLPNLHARIPARKAAWQAQLKLNPPAVLPERSAWAKWVPWHKIDQGGNLLKGYGASAGKVTAPACLLFSPQDFGKMKPGAVLVAVTTTPAWTPLFAMASAIVTDIGGPLSHSSIVAREYGIPAVLATGLATRRIQDGQMVMVDGAAGTVKLL